MSWKYALDAYIKKPECFSAEEIIFYDEKVVIINDKFYKSTFHLLVLARDPVITKQHPTVYLTYNVKDELQEYIEKARDHIFHQFIKLYKPLKLKPFFNDEDEFYDKHFFLEKFIQVGIHRVPSMANLHIHVMTKDLHSAKLKNKKHYNSFTTKFFVDWESLPLDEIPNPKLTERTMLRESDLICIYCGKNFHNKFSVLKQHLSQEFDEHFLLR